MSPRLPQADQGAQVDQGAPGKHRGASKSLRLVLLGTAAFLALNTCIGTGLISGWGKWCSSSLPFRRQTEAFLSGRVVLSASPAAIEHDMAWGPHGVQQVWGLAVPAWRLLFEMPARAFGQRVFPDRLALGAALLLVAYVILRTLTSPRWVRSAEEWVDHVIAAPQRMLAALLILLFPPIITLCRGPFNVYEEAVLYGYCWCLLLYAGAVAFTRRPRLSTYLVVSAMAGASGFLRPTLLAYGVATILVMLVVAFRSKWGWGRLASGPGVFLVGGILLYASNLQRFGAGGEFGHHLNLSAIDMMYTARFGAPFHDTSPWRAAQELFGSLFFVNRLNGFAVYDAEVVAWQADAPRWRHFYETTFDATYLIGLLGCWGMAAWRLSRPRVRIYSEELFVAALWSAASIAPLIAFYLYYYAMSSRYALDFAPAIAVAMAHALLVLLDRRASDAPTPVAHRVIVCGVVACWWGVQVAAAEFSFPPTPPVDRAAVLSELDRELPVVNPLPHKYGVTDNPQESTGIWYNSYGWEHPSGRTRTMVTLFIQQPSRVRVDLKPAAGSLSDEFYRVVRARVGLTPLLLQSITDHGEGKRLTFVAPQGERLPKTIQPLFLALHEINGFRDEWSPFQLVAVSWE